MEDFASIYAGFLHELPLGKTKAKVAQVAGGLVDARGLLPVVVLSRPYVCDILGSSFPTR
jgi:hypothetical protein